MISVAIEASTYRGSVAVFEGDRLMAEREVAMRGRDREALLPALEDVLAAGNVPKSAVGRIVCGAGPGSFTSLRIAGSIAKGLAVGLDRPLYAVSSLALIVAANAGVAETRVVAVLDALRGEHYVAEFEVGPQVRQLSAARVVSSSVVQEMAAAGHVLAGPGIGDDWIPRARGALRVSGLDRAVNLAAWEPDYGRLAEAQVKWEAAQGRALGR